jgi:hypothetical protein
MTNPPTGESRESTSLAESPWFWVILFASMALAALVVVRPKYTLRQARLEQRFDNRIRAKAAQQQPPASDEQAASSNDGDEGSEKVGPTMTELEPVAVLWPLEILLIMVIAGSAVAWILTARRHASRSPEESRTKAETTHTQPHP